MAQKLHNSIMRRVYYMYALRLVFHPVTVHAALLVVCTSMLTHFVSFPNVWANMVNQKLGEVHLFLFESAQSTEVWTLVLGVVMLLALVSLYVQTRRPRHFHAEIAYGQ